jgi:hypothetical protein
MYNTNIKPSASTKDRRVLHLFPTGCKIRVHDFLNFHQQAKIYVKSTLGKSTLRKSGSYYIFKVVLTVLLPVGRDIMAGRKSSVAAILSIRATLHVAAKWPLTEGQNLSP